MPSSRARLRMALYGVVIVIIAVASIVEPPGAVEGIGYAVVTVALLLALLRERRGARR